MKKRVSMKTTVILVSCIMLLSCARQPTGERGESLNYKQNVLNRDWTTEDYDRDHKLCRADAQRKTSFDMDSRAGEKIYRTCMESKGWRIDN
jgi:hypothetical protein